MSTSLRGKLSGLIALLAISIVVGLGGYLTAARAAEGREELHHKAQLYGELMGKQLEPAIAFDDHQTAREVFASLMLDPDVRDVGLYQANGHLLAGAGNPPGMVPTVAGDRVEALVPVVSHEGPRGTLLVRLSTARLAAQEAEAMRASAIAAMGAMLAALAMAWLIAGTVARRLQRIASAATGVAAGDLSQPELAAGPADEIGQLTRAFNTMVNNLRALVSQLRETAATEQQRLNHLVKERTERLDVRNRELEVSREQYRLIAESTSAIPWEFSIAENRFAYVGPQATALLGYAAGDWLTPGFLVSIVVDDDRDRIVAEGAAGMASGKEFELEFRVRGSAGAQVSLRCVASPGPGLLRGLFLDVTARKKLEGELAQAQKLESIWRLAAGVAHEINTPVQYVTDSLFFIREGWKDTLALVADYRALREAVRQGAASPEQANALVEREEQLDFAYLSDHMASAGDSAVEGLARVTEIVRSMKAFAHPDAKDPIDYDLNAGVRSAVIISRGEYKLVADVDVQLGDIPHVCIVPGEINQVLLNLIVNAVHAIESAQRGRGKIRISTAHEGNTVALRVSDDGCGIPDTIRAKVFEQFFTTKPVGKGTGQGLSISRAIVQRHRGDLSFESKPGEGTTFTIRLPVPEPRREAA